MLRSYIKLRTSTLVHDDVIFLCGSLQWSTEAMSFQAKYIYIYAIRLQ